MTAIYVAGSIHEIDVVREVQNALRGEGHTITFDWTGDEGERRREWVTDTAAVERGTLLAQREKDAVVSAGAVVAVLSSTQSQRGTHIELGIAVAYSKLIYLLNHEGHGSVFWTLPDVHRVENIEDLLYRLRPVFDVG